MNLRELLQALEQLGWSQADLARRLDLTPHAVTAWTTGRRPVPGYAAAYLRMALKLKEALDG